MNGEAGGDGVEITPIFIYWQQCKSCSNEVAAHGQVSCGKCGDVMELDGIAGAVVDDRQRRRSR